MYEDEVSRRLKTLTRLVKQQCEKTGDLPVEYTTTTEVITGVGVIPAGVISYSVTNTDGVYTWTFNGASIPANVATIQDSFVGTGTLGTAISFDANGNSLLVMYSI